MKILITGAGGQLGREWVEHLKSSEHSVLACTSNRLDITDSDAIHAVFTEEAPDLLINCAAYTNVDGAEDNPEDAHRVNEIGVQNLAHACSRYGVKLVHYSTDYVFEGSEEDRAKLPGGYDEEYPPSPKNVYGESKRGGEVAIEKFADQWIIIRVSWLCGQYGSNFVKKMLSLMETRNSLQVVNDQTGSPTFCFDVVEKTMRLIEMGERGYFHMSSDGAITWYDLTKEIARLTNQDIELEAVSSENFPMKAKRPSFSLLNTGKIEALGLKPIGWKAGLEKLLNQIIEMES
jgi:dTDP-4-dehydrorhamnose reductase